MNEPLYCGTCGRPMRRRGVPKEHAPGTITAHTIGNPQCLHCYRNLVSLSTEKAVRANELHEEEINLAEIRATQYWTQASCLGLAPTFDETNSSNRRIQRQVCNNCPVWEPCLAEAIALERGHAASLITTVRGGLSAYERRLIQKAHKRTREG